MDEINILHVSDIHCGVEADKQTTEIYKARREKTIDLFFKNFNEEIPESWKPHIVVISGDLAWSGKEEEYVRNVRTPTAIKTTFDEFLANLIEVTDTKNIICCPGNHDKRLTTIGDDVEDYLSEKKMKRLVPFFDGYVQAMEREGIQKLENDPAHTKNGTKIREKIKYLYGYRVVEENGNKLLFVSLNSAWLCNYKRGDEKKLQIGANQVVEVSRLLSERGIKDENLTTVVLFHHPHASWLSEIEVLNGVEESTVNRIRKLANNLVVLNGHQHVQEDDSREDYIVNIAGAISGRDTRASSCNIIKINFGVIPTVKKGTYKLVKDAANNPLRWVWHEGEDEDEDGDDYERPINWRLPPELRRLFLRVIKLINIAHKAKGRGKSAAYYNEVLSLINIRIVRLAEEIKTGAINSNEVSTEVEAITELMESVDANYVDIDVLKQFCDKVRVLALSIDAAYSLEIELEDIRSKEDAYNAFKSITETLMKNAQKESEEKGRIHSKPKTLTLIYSESVEEENGERI